MCNDESVRGRFAVQALYLIVALLILVLPDAQLK